MRKPDDRTRSGRSTRARTWLETGLALALVIGLDRLGWLPRLGDGFATGTAAASGGTVSTTAAGLVLVALTLLVGLVDLLRPRETTGGGRNRPIPAECSPAERDPVVPARIDRETPATSGVGEAWRIWRHG